MTRMPAKAPPRPDDAVRTSWPPAPDASLGHRCEQPCSIRIGRKRRGGVPRLPSARHRVLGGVGGRGARAMAWPAASCEIRNSRL